jgi:Sushi repeat (SCR repeat)
MSENRTSFGVQASYTCHENYTLIGNENRTCDLTGWTGEHPQCLVDWCPEAPAITGGKINISGRRAGSTATYTCDHGYVLLGEPILSCGLGGEWTGKPPSCRYVDCGTPARPDRGTLMLINGSTTVGSIVKYDCDDDYWLTGGDGEQTCTKDGKWSGSTPACECEFHSTDSGFSAFNLDFFFSSSSDHLRYTSCPSGIIRRRLRLQRSLDHHLPLRSRSHSARRAFAEMPRDRRLGQ